MSAIRGCRYAAATLNPRLISDKLPACAKDRVPIGKRPEGIKGQRGLNAGLEWVGEQRKPFVGAGNFSPVDMIGTAQILNFAHQAAASLGA